MLLFASLVFCPLVSTNAIHVTSQKLAISNWAESVQRSLVKLICHTDVSLFGATVELIGSIRSDISFVEFQPSYDVTEIDISAK